MEEDKNHEMEMSEAIYRTFNTYYGKAVLARILALCGFFEVDPSKINPHLIALGNRILQEGGLTITGDMGKYMDAVMASYDGPTIKNKTVIVEGGNVIDEN